MIKLFKQNRYEAGKIPLYYTYHYESSYSVSNTLIRMREDVLLKTIYKRKNHKNKIFPVVLETRFNGKLYPVFDIDGEDILEKFKEGVEGNYAIFTSSKIKAYYGASASGSTGISGYSGISGCFGCNPKESAHHTRFHYLRNRAGEASGVCDPDTHYWVIMDTPIKRVKDFMMNFDWTHYSDKDYNKVCLSENKFVIRGTYENWNRKPFLTEKVGNLSPNFTNMISKIDDYYNGVGLELSAVIYETPELVKAYKRMKKLERIININ